MDLKTLHCPNCNADLDVEDGIDTFFCKYCGHKILLEGQSKAAYDAKLRIKEMEHEERLQDKRDAQERYKMKFKQKKYKDSNFNMVIMNIIIWSAVIILYITNAISGANHPEKELQATVEQIMVDIENEDFSAAYTKAYSLYSSEDEDKWDAIRKDIINQIEQAEEKATGTVTHYKKKTLIKINVIRRKKAF